MSKNLLDLNGKQLEEEVQRIIKDNPQRVKRWTKKELDVLQSMSGKVPSKVIAEQLGRSVNSIDAKLKTLLPGN